MDVSHVRHVASSNKRLEALEKALLALTATSNRQQSEIAVLKAITSAQQTRIATLQGEQESCRADCTATNSAVEELTNQVAIQGDDGSDEAAMRALLGKLEVSLHIAISHLQLTLVLSRHTNPT